MTGSGPQKEAMLCNSGKLAREIVIYVQPKGRDPYRGHHPVRNAGINLCLSLAKMLNGTLLSSGAFESTSVPDHSCNGDTSFQTASLQTKVWPT